MGNYSEIENTIKHQAYVNILKALETQWGNITDSFVTAAAAAKIENTSTVIGAALAVLEHLNDDCPTCPYLDSLEDEDEDFCECGCGEDYPEPPPEMFSRTIKIGDFTQEDAEEDLSSWVASMLDGAYVPSLGTRIVFCTN